MVEGDHNIGDYSLNRRKKAFLVVSQNPMSSELLQACIRAQTLKRSIEFMGESRVASLITYSPGLRSFSEYEDAVILNELLRNARDKAPRRTEFVRAVKRVGANSYAQTAQPPAVRLV